MSQAPEGRRVACTSGWTNSPHPSGAAPDIPGASPPRGHTPAEPPDSEPPSCEAGPCPGPPRGPRPPSLQPSCPLRMFSRSERALSSAEADQKREQQRREAFQSEADASPGRDTPTVGPNFGEGPVCLAAPGRLGVGVRVGYGWRVLDEATARQPTYGAQPHWGSPTLARLTCPGHRPGPFWTRPTQTFEPQRRRNNIPPT